MILKLLPSNNTGLGSTSSLGNVLKTQTASRTLLSVANTYLTTKLTQAEIDIILANIGDFTMAIGYGDNRTGNAGLAARFAIATNWSGGNVTSLLLTPDCYPSQSYNHRLTFSGTNGGSVTLTDNHANINNTYGSIRYFTIRSKR